MLNAMPGLYRFGVPITPSDTVNSNSFPALYVAVGGNAVVTPRATDGSGAGAAADITLTALPAGALIPFAVTAVKSTGTTASLVGLL